MFRYLNVFVIMCSSSSLMSDVSVCSMFLSFQVFCICYSSTNIGEFTNDVRMLAALEENDSEGDRLMGAARLLVGAFTDLLKAAQPDSNEVCRSNQNCFRVLIKIDSRRN